MHYGRGSSMLWGCEKKITQTTPSALFTPALHCGYHHGFLGNMFEDIGWTVKRRTLPDYVELDHNQTFYRLIFILYRTIATDSTPNKTINKETQPQDAFGQNFEQNFFSAFCDNSKLFAKIFSCLFSFISLYFLFLPLLFWVLCLDPFESSLQVVTLHTERHRIAPRQASLFLLYQRGCGFVNCIVLECDASRGPDAAPLA